MGTSEELNAKPYTGGANGGFATDLCQVTSISSAHITVGQACFLEMERVVNQNESPETINLGISFTATDAE